MYINKEKVYQLNVTATKYLAKAASACNAKLVYISTDYVFDGKKTDEYLSSDKPNPLNYYGKTKFLGEKAAQKYCSSTFVCRIS
jgi:dTDP-4-dehydrorhamnose reductase